MGTGHRLGLRLGEWLAVGTTGLDNGTALGNRLCDLLGADQALAGPLRDLARRPLLQQALQSRGVARRSALLTLVNDLESTYTPAVLAELVALLEAALGETGLAAAPPQGPVRDTLASPPEGPERSGTASRSAALPGQHPAAGTTPPPSRPLARPTGDALQRSAHALGRQLRPLGPGLALGAAMALVLSWLAGVLDHQLIQRWQWSGGEALVAALVLLQITTTGRLAPLRRSAMLQQGQSGDPRRAWRWVTAPWIHASAAEALLHGLVLLLILGPSPLPLEDGVLRYGLTALATLALACLSARRLGLRDQHWAGASGVSGALIGLAVGLSLLRWREISFPLGSLAVPAWVLLVVVGSLQLAWILPRRDSADPGGAAEGGAWQRLLVSQWWWGLVLGVGWACLSWGSALLRGWLPPPG